MFGIKVSMEKQISFFCLLDFSDSPVINTTSFSATHISLFVSAYSDPPKYTLGQSFFSADAIMFCLWKYVKKQQICRNVQYCWPAPNQPKSQILLYKNSSPRDLDTMTLAATNSTYYAVMVSFSSHLTVVIYCLGKKKKKEKENLLFYIACFQGTRKRNT